MTPTPTSTSSRRPVALVTGGGRGLGKNVALALARRGVDVVITYRARAADAAAVVAAIRERDGRALALALDVSDADTFPAFVEALRAAVARDFGGDRLDILVNNAGIGGYAPVAATTRAQFAELQRVHLEGPFFLTQALLDLLADGGRVLNVSTGLARFSLPGYGAYAMMKGGIETFTRYLARELGPRGITVNTLAPGAIETDFGGGAVRDNPDVNRFVASVTALGRAGVPDDIGPVAAFLTSPEARWVTGQRIEVSGGMFL